MGKEGKRRGNGGEEVEEKEGKGDREVARKGKLGGGGALGDSSLRLARRLGVKHTKSHIH